MATATRLVIGEMCKLLATLKRNILLVERKDT